ncbi:MAG TPA: hypothetical protein VG028_12115 [Terriglobia bacterium]|nr:hypothetical protein [Terriglobia bacterium]
MKSSTVRRTHLGVGETSGWLAAPPLRVLAFACASVMLCGLAAPGLVAQQAAPSADRSAAAPGIEEELRAMREEIHALRQEVNGLREELRASLPDRQPALDRPARSQTEGIPAPKRQLASINPEGMIAERITAGSHQSLWQKDADGIPRSSTLEAAASLPGPGAGQKYAEPSQGAVAAPPDTDQQNTDLASSVSMLQSEVAEQAQTKVESNSKMAVKLFGTILSTTFFNSGAADWPDVPGVVNWAKAVPSSTGSFSSSMRQSRIGLMVDGPDIGSMHASGYLAVDFLGGAADFQSGPLFGLPHVVYGYVRLDGAKTALEAGQDEMILAPRHPTSLVAMSFPELFRSGDLYDRAPQVRVERELAGNKRGSLRATVGLVAPVANYPGLDFPGAGLLEAWQRPAVQGRLAWRPAEAPSSANRGFEFGFSAHYGTVQLGTMNYVNGVPAFNPRVGFGASSAASWAGAFDFDAHLHRVGMDGSAYIGQNLESFGGGIGQPGKTSGGYIEGRFAATDRLQFNSGFGTDHLNKFDIVPVDLNRNTSVFANTIFQFTPEVAASFEYRHLVTRPFTGVLRTNNHVDVGIAYSF